MKTLILGGVRSGKSRLAESLASRSGKRVTYIATAAAGDEEMRARIAAHRARRSPDWTVVEEPIRLGAALQAHGANGALVLIDCLTLWLTNLLVAANDAQFEHERDALLASLTQSRADIVLVSNETGLGIMPLGELTRRFGDEAGRLHQELAQRCERVVLTIAGLPSVLKGEPI